MHAPWPFQQHENCKCTVNTISRKNNPIIPEPKTWEKHIYREPRIHTTDCLLLPVGPNCLLSQMIVGYRFTPVFISSSVLSIKAVFCFPSILSLPSMLIQLQKFGAAVNAQSSAWWVLKFSLKPSSLSIKKGIQGARLACSGEWFNRVLCNNLWTIIIASIVYSFR